MAGLIRARRRLHVHHLITKLELGGAQQNTLYCVRNHDRGRFAVSLGYGPGGILDAEAGKIPRASVRPFRSLHREVNPPADVRFVLEFIRFLRRERVDILHTHSSKAGILGRAAAALAGTPAVIHTVHGWGFHDFQNPLSRRLFASLERLAARHTDILIAVSRENMERGLRLGIGCRMQYRVIRSGIEISRFARPRRSRAAVRKALGIPASVPLVINVGNFKPQKAPLDFVRAAAAAARRCRRARFLMVGDGELLPEAKRRAGRLGIGPLITFAGWRRDVADLLHAADIFALSSLFEGLPRAVLQAKAAGLPVLATRAGGTPEAVNEGKSGHLVRPGRPEELGKRMAELLANPRTARAMGQAGRRELSEDFDIRKMLRQIEQAYREIAESKGLA